MIYDTIADNYKSIAENIELAKQRAGRKDAVRVMAVTKTVAAERITEAVACGIGLLGENRVQEFLKKSADYPKSAEVHFIGGLQSNKIRQIIDKVSMIHSVDSLKAANEIGVQAQFHKLEMNVLIQINIGGEPTKNGIAPEELGGFAEEISAVPGIRLRGLMTVPPIGSASGYFGKMQSLFESLKSKYEGVDTLSMGMSGDYAEAVAFGSTLVRLGTALFGTRDYTAGV